MVPCSYFAPQACKRWLGHVLVRVNLWWVRLSGDKTGRLYGTLTGTHRLTSTTDWRCVAIVTPARYVRSHDKVGNVQEPVMWPQFAGRSYPERERERETSSFYQQPTLPEVLKIWLYFFPWSPWNLWNIQSLTHHNIWHPSSDLSVDWKTDMFTIYIYTRTHTHRGYAKEIAKTKTKIWAKKKLDSSLYSW